VGGGNAFVKVGGVRALRLTAALSTAAVLFLLQAQAAVAADGVGLAGRVTEKTVTFIMLAVIAFFPILVITLAIIQGRLEARKDRRRYDLERLR
jgi:hypothetical protein